MSTELLGRAVDACEALTSVVENKTSEIDSKVKIALGDLPATISQIMDATIYVSNDNGDDIDYPKPFHTYKTIKCAIESFPPGALLNVILHEGRHFIDEHIEVENKRVMLKGQGKIKTDVIFKKIQIDASSKFRLVGFNLNHSYLHTSSLTYRSDVESIDELAFQHPYDCPVRLNFDSSISFSCCNNQAIDGIFTHFVLLYPNTGTVGSFVTNSLEVEGVMSEGLMLLKRGAVATVEANGLVMSAKNKEAKTADLVVGDIVRDTNQRAINVIGMEV
ncbi:hypothetical protein [Pseudoalteromonas obscura]|uniref:Uncharacterized protein n=1 Tax=Pseudoalteromonas obscura TaxID=3048491 RepID=A0ABT7EJG3_9GAMM|nr:hypothetical protein [Pseudoalteromonas sp. P94(2023)]MDK2595201.1 hypothetical protein [Pseudoalteromonas sp. P94(2023)]